MRKWLIAAWLIALCGCGPKVSREEMGEVIFTLPKVQPVETPVPDQPAAPVETPAATSQTPNE